MGRRASTGSSFMNLIHCINITEMKTRIFHGLLLAGMTVISLRAQPPTCIWAKTILGNVESIQRSILSDAAGNVYISGVFFGTVDFDPGPGVASITPSPYGCNVYIAKYDAFGNYCWARNIPITASYGGSQMTLDAANNIYITGYFQGTNVDFDPGAGTAYLSANGGSNDAYLAKYDSNGNYLWARQLGAAGDDRGMEVLADASGNVLLTGNFSQTVDFDPGAGVTNLTSAGTTDIFLARFSPGGVMQWVKQIGGSSGDEVRDMAFDNAGNIFLTGNFFMTSDFDPGPALANLTSAAASDIFIAKYDPSGNYLWASRFGGSGTDGGSALKTDNAGNILLTGIFAGTVDFDPGVAVANLITASSALFFGRYDANGNLAWIKQLPINYYSMDIALEASGNILISGYYGNGYPSPIDMDPGPGVASLSVPTNLPPPTYNILGRYDASGNYLWAGVFGHQCYCSVMGLKSSLYVDNAGFLYYAGTFNGSAFGSATVDFDPGPGVISLTAPNAVDNVFFAKYSISSIPLPVSLLSFTGSRLYGVNRLTWSTASERNNCCFEVERSKDAGAFERIGSVAGMGQSNTLHSYVYDDSYSLPGPVYYRLRQIDFNGQFSFSPVIVMKGNNITGADVRTVSRDRFNIHLTERSCGTIRITDGSGRIIQEWTFADREIISIDLSGLPGGLYLACILTADGIKSIRLMHG